MVGTPVQNSLMALVPLKSVAVDEIREKLKHDPVNPVGLNEVGTVHFARIFVTPENNPAGIPDNLIAVVTAYDGDFSTYIQAFLNNPEVGPFFNSILPAIDDPDAAGLIPVEKNAAAFVAFIQKYDITNPDTNWGQWYSAYPEKTVQNILAH